ncbi:bifunctional DNA primase/polymerase [Streptomyces sp. DSM 42041]|uniref:Bifunctional DNA primase/polymerase n=1 Tax=Streptomyces hazeniae TaxID=3075538 RepID=A0ABU2NTH4_9ACTN|nr:bifunctional DNA primase/polymerase [Streptomyces sp. DSM 42041]MDT0380291.1 bifunctional DNA primase/polymerase [Streptomyces sp. DSM 42041]
MTHHPPTALVSAALDAAARGWPVFPLRPGAKAPALHGEERCPRTGDCAAGHAKWEQRATTDPDRIRACWAAGGFNVGIATGPAGLVVIDMDKPKDKSKTDLPDGRATFEALCERTEHVVPVTRTVRTASGGEHLYFTAPEGVRLGNSAGRLGKLIDTRAHGGYVVAPGSTTPAGAYEVTDDAPVVPLPGWLRDALTPAQRPMRPVVAPVARDASRYALAALRNETANVAAAGEGCRNWTLTRAARALGRLVASGDLAREVVEEALRQAGESAGLRPRYCDGVITSALNWSIAHNPGQAA